MEALSDSQQQEMWKLFGRHAKVALEAAEPAPPTYPTLAEHGHLLALFWVLPVLLCLTKGSIGIARLVPSKLFSREDETNIHKLLGFGCLLHFIVRMPFLPSDCAFDGSLLTPACMLMHALLSLSSIIFKLPLLRIKEGSRIWPEFRLHSIVFACRSIACLLIVWFEERYRTGPHYLLNVAVVFATLKAADISTNSVDPRSRSNTIRGLETSAIYKYAFSMMQFLGTCGCLVGLRGYSAQFAIIFVIQTYAFTLTLRRKNLVTHRSTIVIYACQLTLGFGIANWEIIRLGGVDAIFMFVALALVAGSLRMFCGLNKYLVWAIMSVVVQFARRCTVIVPPEERYEFWPVWGWPAASVALAGVFVAAASAKEKGKAAAAKAEAAAKEKLAAKAPDVAQITQVPTTPKVEDSLKVQ